MTEIQRRTITKILTESEDPLYYKIFRLSREEVVNEIIAEEGRLLLLSFLEKHKFRN
jgi:uncharacterized protein (UPF0128 family)